MIQTDERDADARLAGRVSVIKIEPGPDPKPIAITLQPARTITGRVTYADTGRPVPHAPVQVQLIHYQADGEGRFRARRAGRPSGFGVQAQSPDGARLPAAETRRDWPKGAVEQSVELALRRGVVVRGKVVEEGTGRPIAGAIVRFR